MEHNNDTSISKVPSEIWWKIFEYVVVPKNFVNIVYEGSDWIGDAKEMEQIKPNMQLKALRRQLIAISLVCRSWRSFADSFRCRFVALSPTPSNEPLTDAIFRAHRVHLNVPATSITRMEGREVGWKAVGVTQENMSLLGKLRRPNLCRLEVLYLGDEQKHFEVDGFIAGLKSFTNITWLRYYTDTIIFDACRNDDGGERVTLPNLQVLHYQGVGAFHLPYYRLILPSLRHLFIFAHGFAHREYVPLRSIIAAYGSTLRSLFLEIVSGGQLGIPEDPDFPDWTSVPHLEELAIDAPVVLKFPPLPLTHPLRVFAAQVWRIDDLLSWLDSDSLNTVRMLHAKKNDDGSLVSQHQMYVQWTQGLVREFSPAEMEALEAKAKLKGIVLQACWEPNGTR
ncbi:hypothetical protein FRC17_010513 [Serendipita sp. 399]|nr:hypothetical protein FRC17_010513 [Serendipita sp. 399]